jgi:DNA-binding MarR family transcriptional regulator
MPPHGRRKTSEAVGALVGVAPLTSRWMERLLARHDPPLTLAQYLALRAIEDRAPGAGELAQRTGVSGPAVSQLLAGLVDRGLVERAEAAGDRRRQQLGLSRGGSLALTSANRLLRKELGSLLEDLPRPEADALARALPHVEALLAGTAPPRRPPPPRGPGRGAARAAP